MYALIPIAMVACTSNNDGETPTGDTGSDPVEPFPLPDDLDQIDWPTVFQDAVLQMVTVNTQSVWKGHLSTLDTRQVGCPDFWQGTFTSGTQTVGGEEGIAWNDDCETAGGLYYDGWLWWDSAVVEVGDPTTYDGRSSDANRTVEGDAIVGNNDGVRFEFDGTATDSFYNLEAYGYQRFTYSSTVEGTVTGRDVFDGSLTPDGYRTDLFMYITGGDVDTFEARGNVYMFDAQLHERFDSIEVDMALVGPTAAAPGDCTLEPLGWIGVRDPEPFWYSVVFLPRFEEDVVGEPYVNEELSACDGCGQLYVEGVEIEGVEVCVDFSFLFDGTSFPLPDPDDYVLPLRAL